METKDTDAFNVTFLRAGKEGERLQRLLLSGLCPVTFFIERGKQRVEFTVYVDEEAHAQEDYIKVAQHQLHHDFARLAEQTKHWDMPGLVVSKKTMLDDGEDLPF